MDVKIHKNGKKLVKESVWNKIPDAINMFIDYHNLNSYKVPVYITFERGDIFQKDSLGEVNTKFTFSCFMYFKPKSFIIFIDPTQSEKELMNTIFHEFTHVKQYCTRQMSISYTKGFSVWEGKHFRSVNGEDIELYKNAPWEIDARNTADKMIDIWKKGYTVDKSKSNILTKFKNCIIDYFK